MLHDSHESWKASIVAQTEAKEGCVCGATRFGLISALKETIEDGIGDFVRLNWSTNVICHIDVWDLPISMIRCRNVRHVTSVVERVKWCRTVLVWLGLRFAAGFGWGCDRCCGWCWC